jgi:hypothetical protein
LEERLHEIETRYRAIAAREGALDGYGRGIDEARATLADQPRTPLPAEHWDRFTGLAAARHGLAAAHGAAGFRSAALVARGKHDWAVERALRELGVEVRPDAEGVRGRADPRGVRAGGRASDEHALVIGTLSPGPRRDAMRVGVVSPVMDDGAGTAGTARAVGQHITDSSRHSAA